MDNNSSRRNFIATGLALPVAGLASASLPAIPAPAAPAAAQQGSALSFRTLGKTGLKVTSVGFGCMITSDQSVVEKGADLGITYFDTARGYQQGNNERMVGAALKSKRKDIILATKTGGRQKAGRAGPPGYQPEGTADGLRRHLAPARQEQHRASHRRSHRRPADREEGRARSASPA